MRARYTRLRVRRKLKHKQKDIEKAGSEAGKKLEKHVVRRLSNLKEVRRFVSGWLVLVALLITGVILQTSNLSVYYQRDIPIAGGTYREGIVGNLTNMNPIYATSSMDRAAAKLIFSSLLKYDQDNRLVGDLAKSWSVSKDGKTYTVKLHDNVYWHDGEKFDSEDVVFTYDLIQTPDATSVLNQSWQNITVQAKDEHTVTFVLPNSFTPFLHSLTRGGILPKHILSDTLPSQVRGSDFNTQNPIGTGPFKVNLVTDKRGQKSVTLGKFEEYFAGKPKLDAFELRSFADHETMISTYIDGEINSMANLRTIDRDQILDEQDTIWYDIPMNNGMYLFFKNSDPVLKSKNVRTALTHGTNTKVIRNLLDNRFKAADSPILKNQFAYNEDLTQFGFARKRANQILDKEGWKVGEDGIRMKGNQKLTINLVTQNSDDYPLIVEELQKQWKEIGVDLQVNLVGEDEIQQNHIVPHNYQVLLFGITIGADPDVFAYWHSSQAGVGGFNLSEYKNTTADLALEQGRTRQGNALRSAKYDSFLEEWRADAPAVALYQPGFSYAQHSKTSGFDMNRISTPDDRFNYVHLWTINTKRGDKLY